MTDAESCININGRNVQCDWKIRENKNNVIDDLNMYYKNTVRFTDCKPSVVFYVGANLKYFQDQDTAYHLQGAAFNNISMI